MADLRTYYGLWATLNIFRISPRNDKELQYQPKHDPKAPWFTFHIYPTKEEAQELCNAFTQASEGE